MVFHPISMILFNPLGFSVHGGTYEFPPMCLFSMVGKESSQGIYKLKLYFSYQLLPSNLLITQVTGSSQGIPGYQGTPKMPYSKSLPEARTTSFGSRSEAEAGTTFRRPGEAGTQRWKSLSTFNWASKNAPVSKP